MTAPRVVGLGAGGNARSVLDALRLSGQAQIIGLLDNDSARHGTMLDGVPILGGDSLLPQLIADGIDGFFIGVGGGGMAPFSGRPRQQVFELGVTAGLRPVSVRHPSALVSPVATVGAGVILLAGSIVNAGAQIGEGALINSGAIVEHDCVVGAHAHIATGACLAGAVTVGALAHVGAGAVVRQGITLGEGSLVGLGATVVANVAPGVVVAGVPARPLKTEKPAC